MWLYISCRAHGSDSQLEVANSDTIGKLESDNAKLRQRLNSLEEKDHRWEELLVHSLYVYILKILRIAAYLYTVASCNVCGVVAVQELSSLEEAILWAAFT